MLIEKMKTQMITAMKSKNIVERDILRHVIGAIQTAEATQNKKFNDEQIESVIRKQITNIDEALTFLEKDDERYSKLVVEKMILNELVPETLTQDEIEAFLLNSDGPEVEQIRDVKNDGQAIGIAMKCCKSNDLKVLGDDVKAVVTKIRSEIA